MAIPITDNTTLLRSLKDKANNLPNQGTSGGTDVSGVTATAEDVLAGKVIVNSSGQEVTGTMTNNGAVSQTVTSNGDVSIAKGYHNGNGKITVNVEGGTSIPTDGTATAANVLKGKTFYSGGSKKTGTMPTVTLGNPTISIDSATGKITSTASTSGSGYIGDAEATNTYNLPTAEGTTITPTTVSQTVVAKNVWTLGASTVAGDTSLIASNIKSGVSIFGVTGTYSGKTSGGYDANSSIVPSYALSDYDNVEYLFFDMPKRTGNVNKVALYALDTNYISCLDGTSSNYYITHLFVNFSNGSYIVFYVGTSSGQIYIEDGEFGTSMSSSSNLKVTSNADNTWSIVYYTDKRASTIYGYMVLYE